MKATSLLTDSYERKARLYPALLLIAPVLIAVIGTGWTSLSVVESFTTLAAGCGGAFLLAQLARDSGKKRERDLFESWGGLPSIAVLRHRDARIDPLTKARYHKLLSTQVKGTKAPTLQEENADPAKADEVYAAWSSYLRVHTRDTKKYPLVFRENVSYGYRRNVFGLRPIGICVSVTSLVAAGVWLAHLYAVSGTISKESIGALACIVVLLSLWVFRFTQDWVRIPADAYALRLAESVDSMPTATRTAKSETK